MAEFAGLTHSLGPYLELPQLNNISMTIAVRNRIILSGLGITILMLIIFLISVILIFQNTSFGAGDALPKVNLTRILILLFSVVCFCIITVVIFYLSFRKTTAPEMFFFLIFLISISFDCLKAMQALFTIREVAPYYAGLMTRLVYFGKYLGTMCILVSGLFAHNTEYQRMEIYLGVALLLSFTLSYAVPVDFTTLRPNLLSAIGYAEELFIISTLFLAFGVLNYLYSALQDRSSSHLLMATGITAVIIGRELVFYLDNSIGLIVAFLLLIGGTTLFGERTHEVHLWG